MKYDLLFLHNEQRYQMYGGCGVGDIHGKTLEDLRYGYLVRSKRVRCRQTRTRRKIYVTHKLFKISVFGLISKEITPFVRKVVHVE